MNTEQTIRFSAIKALDKFASHDTKLGRPILQTIHVDKGYAIAADGFRLMATPTNTNGFTGNLHPAEVLSLGKAVKKPTTLHLETPETGGTRAVITDDKCAPQIAKDITVTDAAYPDWQQIMPAEEPAVSVRLNARYLRDLADAALTMGAEWDSVVLHVYEPDKPVKFTINDNEGIESQGVIMPMMLRQ